MKNKKAIGSEIIKLRKILAMKNFSNEQKDKAWAVMLALQWVVAKSSPFCTPVSFCGIHNVGDKQLIKRAIK